MNHDSTSAATPHESLNRDNAMSRITRYHTPDCGTSRNGEVVVNAEGRRV